MSMGYADVRRAVRGVAAAMVMVAVLCVAGGGQFGCSGATRVGVRVPGSKVAAIVARVEKEVAAQGLVGVSVAVAQDGEVGFERHWGFEDREAGGPGAGYRGDREG